MKRLNALVIALLMSLTPVVPDAGAAEPLRIAYLTWVGFGPLFLAKEKGFFKEQGVEVELEKIEDVKMSFAAMAAKRIDGNAATPNTILLYVKPDQRFVIVMALDDSQGGDGIVARKEIKTLADLKGKRVAFSEGGISQFYLNYLLKRVGLSQSDVVPVNMTAGDAGAAFVAGRVDAAVTWEPWLTKGKNAPHGHILIDSRQTPGIISDTLAFREDVLRSRRDDVRKVVRAIHQAVEHWKRTPKESVEIMAKGVGGWLKDPTAFEETLTGAKLYDAPDNKKFFGTRAQPGPIFQNVKEAIDFWRQIGRLPWTGVRAEDIIDPSFLE